MDRMKNALARASRYYREPITLELLRNTQQMHRYSGIRGFVSAYLRAAKPMIYSYPRLGQIFDQHHSTIMYCEKAAQRRFGPGYFDGLVWADERSPEASRLAILGLETA